MSQVASHRPHGVSYDRAYEGEDEQVTGWVGWIGFAGVMMILGGMFQAIAGLIAIFQKTFFTVSSDQLVLIHNVQDWGWVNFIIGSVIVLAGISLFSGTAWARVLAVTLAMLSAIANLVSITLYPFWSLICIAISVMVIYALIVHGSELRE